MKRALLVAVVILSAWPGVWGILDANAWFYLGRTLSGIAWTDERAMFAVFSTAASIWLAFGISIGAIG